MKSKLLLFFFLVVFSRKRTKNIKIIWKLKFFDFSSISYFTFIILSLQLVSSFFLFNLQSRNRKSAITLSKVHCIIFLRKFSPGVVSHAFHIRQTWQLFWLRWDSILNKSSALASALKARPFFFFIITF